MSIFRSFELKVIELLTQEALSQDLRTRLVQEAQFVSLEFTGVGYFLTARHNDLPLQRIVCNAPLVTGEVSGIAVGFIIFLMDRELTIECFSYGESIPENIREFEVPVQISLGYSSNA